MDRLAKLNPSIRRRMPPKRSGAPLFVDIKPRKRTKILKTQKGYNVSAGIKKYRNNQNHQLQRIFDHRMSIPCRLYNIGMAAGQKIDLYTMEVNGVMVQDHKTTIVIRGNEIAIVLLTINSMKYY